MSEKKEDVIEGPGFTIIDRRIGAKTSAGGSKTDTGKTEKGKTAQKHEGESGKTKEKEDLQAETSQEIPLPDVDFTSFMMSLCTSVFIHLGEIPDPTTNETHVNLPLAKQTIDLISMLKEKTEGNRTADEDKLMDEMLYTMRMKYLSASNQTPS